MPYQVEALALLYIQLMCSLAIILIIDQWAHSFLLGSGSIPCIQDCPFSHKPEDVENKRNSTSMLINLCIILQINEHSRLESIVTS